MAGYAGKQGRKPKPGKIVEGNRDDKLERLPSPPRYLTAPEKKEWKRVGKLLREAGLITNVDLDALASYCRAFVRWIDAEEEVRRVGMVIKSPKGWPMQNPYLSVANRAQEQMMGIMREMGLTPASRTRLPKSRKPQEPRKKASVTSFDPRNLKVVD